MSRPCAARPGGPLSARARGSSARRRRRGVARFAQPAAAERHAAARSRRAWRVSSIPWARGATHLLQVGRGALRPARGCRAPRVPRACRGPSVARCNQAANATRRTSAEAEAAALCPSAARFVRRQDARRHAPRRRMTPRRRLSPRASPRRLARQACGVWGARGGGAWPPTPPLASSVTRRGSATGRAARLAARLAVPGSARDSLSWQASWRRLARQACGAGGGGRGRCRGRRQRDARLDSRPARGGPGEAWTPRGHPGRRTAGGALRGEGA